MKEYITTIIYICIFSIILELILPSNKLKKYIQVLMSLILIIILINPVVNVLIKEDVVESISSTLESLSGKTNWKEYDFSDLKSNMIFGNVKENLEEELYNECKNKFASSFDITDVKVDLNANYNVEAIKIYVLNVEEVANLSQIISFIQETYGIDKEVIKIIKEG